MSGRVVLSRSPYLGRTRSRMDIDTVVQYRSKEREGTSMRENNHSQTRSLELEARLLAVCDSLEAKTQQCKFLMHQNQQLNNRLIELSKSAGEQDSLSISSKMGYGEVINVNTNTNINTHTNLQQLLPKKEFQDMQVQTKDHPTDNRQHQLTQKIKEQVCRLTTRLTSMEQQQKRTELELAQKTKLADKLNRSLLEAIESSSALMKQRGELARKLEQTTINMRQIQALYSNAKRYIFKGMELSQSDIGDADSERSSSMGDISRMECQRSRELEIVRYQLTLKTKECEDKELQIMNLQKYQVEGMRYKHIIHDLQKELEELRKRHNNYQVNQTSRIGKAHRTVINQLGQISHQLELCERLGGLSPRPPQHIIGSVPEFLERTTSEIQHLASSVIARKLEVERFMRQLHQRLSSHNMPAAKS